MIALLQRVLEAEIQIDRVVVASIKRGLLVFVGVRPDDDAAAAQKLLERTIKYRVFGDEQGKMNLNLGQIDGDLLLVPQFTLAADTRHGLRPGFSTAAAPDLGRRLFEGLVAAARTQHPRVQCGVFGADMQVGLVNDGPVTFWLET
jgi:D-tyrosyl-tRNA(Tyr) deacylase